MTTFDSTTAAASAADDHAQQPQAQQQPSQPQQLSAAAAHAAKAGHFLSVNAAIGDAFGSSSASGNGNGERQSSTDLLARDMKTSSAASSAAPSRATSRATTPTFGALELGAVVMVESPQTSARSSTNSANGAGSSGLGSGQFEAKRPAPIVIVKDESEQRALSGPDGVLKIRALRTDGSARLDDDKEVPSVDIDSRLYAQSPHPSAIPILSRQSSKGYNLGTEQSEVKLQTQGSDPMGLFSPTAAGHAQAMAVKARAVAIADLDAQGKHFDARGRARTNSNAAAMAGKAKAAHKEAEDGGCRDCAGCTLM